MAVRHSPFRSPPLPAVAWVLAGAGKSRHHLSGGAVLQGVVTTDRKTAVGEPVPVPPDCAGKGFRNATAPDTRNKRPKQNQEQVIFT